MKHFVNFFKEVKTELEKVTWPTRKEVVNYLSLVIVISLVVAIFIGGVDYLLTKALEILLKK